MYRICWRSKLTGKEGQSSSLFTKEIGEAWIKETSNDPNLIHWLEEEKSTDNQPLDHPIEDK